MILVQYRWGPASIRSRKFLGTKFAGRAGRVPRWKIGNRVLVLRLRVLGFEYASLLAGSCRLDIWKSDNLGNDNVALSINYVP